MTRNRLYFLILIFSLTGYGLVLINLSKKQQVYSNKTLCLFKNITSIPCPSCGTTRSVSYIAEGKFKDAVKLNPLGYLAAVLLAVLPIWTLVDIIRKKNGVYNLYNKAESFLKKRWFVILSVLLICANWVWNLYKGI